MEQIQSDFGANNCRRSAVWFKPKCDFSTASTRFNGQPVCPGIRWLQSFELNCLIHLLAPIGHAQFIPGTRFLILLQAERLPGCAISLIGLWRSMMARGYVSEFTSFMGQYLKEHPAVVEEQRICAGVLKQGETRPDGSAVNPPRVTLPAAPVLPRAPKRFFKWGKRAKG